jgi:hypothetical protein
MPHYRRDGHEKTGHAGHVAGFIVLPAGNPAI